MKRESEVLTQFLQNHRFTSQFLLDVFKTDEYFEINATNQNFIVIKKDDSISFVGYLSKSGIFHAQGIPPIAEDLNEFLFAQIVNGISGPSHLVQSLTSGEVRQLHSKNAKSIHEDFVFKLNLPAPMPKPTRNVERLNIKDFEQWNQLYGEYLTELGLANTATKEDRLARFTSETEQRWHWGIHENEKLVAIGAYNARTAETAQIGGVFTIPAARGKKLAEDIMKQILLDSSADPKLKELILTTGPLNSPPAKLYSKLGFEIVDRYTMIVF